MGDSDDFWAAPADDGEQIPSSGDGARPPRPPRPPRCRRRPPAAHPPPRPPRADGASTKRRRGSALDPLETMLDDDRRRRVWRKYGAARAASEGGSDRAGGGDSDDELLGGAGAAGRPGGGGSAAAAATRGATTTARPAADVKPSPAAALRGARPAPGERSADRSAAALVERSRAALARLQSGARGPAAEAPSASPEARPPAPPAAPPAAAAAAAAAAGAAGKAPKVEFKFAIAGGRSIQLRMRETDTFGAAFDAFLAAVEEKGWCAPGAAARFSFDGDAVARGARPADLGAEDGDQIEARFL